MHLDPLNPAVVYPIAEPRPVHVRWELDVLRDPDWLTWLVVFGLLVAHVAGVPHARAAALAICVAAGLLVAARRGSLRPYGAQVRLGYFVLLLPTLVPAVEPLLYLPLAGTAVRLLFGYCAMGRLLMLMPWNREGPLTFAYLRRVVLTPSTGGGLLRVSRASPGVAAGPAPAPAPFRIASCKDR